MLAIKSRSQLMASKCAATNNCIVKNLSSKLKSLCVLKS